MINPQLDIGARLATAVSGLGIPDPARITTALLEAPEQTKGPCIARCVHCGEMTIILWRDPAGFELPEHAHSEQKQTSVVLDGKFLMTIGGATKLYGPRSGPVTIEAGVVHSGSAETNCIVVDVFSPRRTDFEGVEAV